MFRPFCSPLPLLALFPLACALPRTGPYRIPPADPQLDPAAAANDQPFWFGVSTSAYQIEEPGPVVTDWDLCHQQGTITYARTDAVGGFAGVERDIAALKWLGVTHYRFGICWARVEPRDGEFDDEAIAHYVNLARRLCECGITPVVCLWHFTFPAWLTDLDEPEAHGWLHPRAAEAWRRFVRRAVEPLAPHVELFAPMNEPNAYALAVSLGLFPPMKITSVDFYDNLIAAQVDRFREAAKIIREVRPGAQILSIQNIGHWRQDVFDPLGIWYRLAIDYNYGHLDGISDAVDLVGFNYYQSEVASIAVAGLQGLRSGPDVSDLGWTIDSEGLEREIVALARRYQKPLVITENGIADSDDDQRPQYLRRHLDAICNARRAGYDVRGYFHWSLMDNYEWNHGYAARFGLFAVSPKGDELVPKESAELYRGLIRSGFMLNCDIMRP